ncbi:DUF6626 family protein [Duganella sp. HH105]|uniref:DUF6626 family protein n=1 Tax=Duganella sp. HH105 TaxID=1781067 RepID=UPI000877D0B0|nr:DUF6626 family protein [Duganella sp. HH105]OEZ55670.1 hypothetical protein DUGA6_53240 [Duganella sp. HH105]
MKIDEIYEALKGHNLCRSRHDFSRNYLGKHQSYMSVIKARGEPPSIEAWAMLSYALQSRAQVFAGSDNEFIQAAATRLQELQQAAAANVMKECAARNR